MKINFLIYLHNLLIGNLLEAKIIYNSLSEDEKSAFGEYPISKFLDK